MYQQVEGPVGALEPRSWQIFTHHSYVLAGLFLAIELVRGARGVAQSLGEPCHTLLEGRGGARGPTAAARCASSPR